MEEFLKTSISGLSSSDGQMELTTNQYATSIRNPIYPTATWEYSERSSVKLLGVASHEHCWNTLGMLRFWINTCIGTLLNMMKESKHSINVLG